MVNFLAFPNVCLSARGLDIPRNILDTPHSISDDFLALGLTKIKQYLQSKISIMCFISTSSHVIPSKANHFIRAEMGF